MSLLLGPLGIQISTADLVLNGKPQTIVPTKVDEPRGTDYESPAPAAAFTAYTLTCEPGAYVYVGNDATLDYVPGAVTVNYALTCDAGEYGYTGNAATLKYVSGAEKEPVLGPGSGHPAGIWWGETKLKRGKRLDDVLRKAMERMVAPTPGTAPLELPVESPAARAVEIVKPFVDRERIDWSAIEADLTRVRELLALWQEQADSLEDEEILLMLMA